MSSENGYWLSICHSPGHSPVSSKPMRVLADSFGASEVLKAASSRRLSASVSLRSPAPFPFAVTVPMGSPDSG